MWIRCRDLVRTVIVGGAFVGAAACARESTPRQPTQAQAQAPSPGTQPMGGDQDMAGMCPMHVPGARTTVQDIEGGVAMVFTTTGDVAALRTHVREMAQMHNRMGAHAMGGGMQHGGMQGRHAMVESDATVIDVEDGARVELRPRDPAQLDELRAQARMHSQQMATGQCPRMMPERQATRG